MKKTLITLSILSLLSSPVMAAKTHRHYNGKHAAAVSEAIGNVTTKEQQELLCIVSDKNKVGNEDVLAKRKQDYEQKMFELENENERDNNPFTHKEMQKIAKQYSVDNNPLQTFNDVLAANMPDGENHLELTKKLKYLFIVKLNPSQPTQPLIDELNQKTKNWLICY